MTHRRGQPMCGDDFGRWPERQDRESPPVSGWQIRHPLTAASSSCEIAGESVSLQKRARGKRSAQTAVPQVANKGTLRGWRARGERLRIALVQKL